MSTDTTAGAAGGPGDGGGLADRVSADLTTAMKARDAGTVAPLRMVVAAIRNARVAEGRVGDLTDDDVVALIDREAKKRVEAAETYERAGRGDLAAKERGELDVLRRYLPERLDDAALAALVDDAVRETGASGPGDLGRVMKVVMPRTRGRADGRQVQALVRERLTGAG